MLNKGYLSQRDLFQDAFFESGMTMTFQAYGCMNLVKCKLSLIIKNNLCE